MINLYIEISVETVRLIPQDGFSIVHIPFVRMVKLHFIQEFPVGHLALPVIPNLIPFLR